jgi:hypothetical protein
MAHTTRTCEGCSELIHKYDDCMELECGRFFHYRCLPKQ